jgi:hypothetical protein
MEQIRCMGDVRNAEFEKEKEKLGDLRLDGGIIIK